jgi:hypothetical protein
MRLKPLASHDMLLIASTKGAKITLENEIDPQK